MDDAQLRGAATQTPAERLYARDVLLDPADGNGRQSRGARAHLQDDQRRNATLLLLRLPHWDPDLPSTIYDLPFLSEQAKRNILGGNAKRVFNLEPVISEVKQRGLAARNAAE